MAEKLLTTRQVQTAGEGDHSDGAGLLLGVRDASATWVFRFTAPSGRRFHSMRVRVSLRREKGNPRPPYGPRTSATGDLHLTYIAANGRNVQALQLLGADRDCPRLFEPRLVSLSTNIVRFVGFERDEAAWHMQEWECELV